MSITKLKLKKGYKFSRFAYTSEGKIYKEEIPQKIFIPVEMNNAEKKILVSKGDKVEEGEVLVTFPSSTIPPVISSVQGEIKDIFYKNIGDKSIQMIEIKPLQNKQKTNFFEKQNWENVSLEKLKSIIFSSGIIKSYYYKNNKMFLKDFSFDKIKVIVIKENEPDVFFSSLNFYIKEKIDKFFISLKILKKVFSQAKIFFGINEKSRNLFKNYLKEFSDFLEVFIYQNKYPLGNNHLLFKLLKKKYKNINVSLEEEVLFFSFQKLMGMYQAVVERKPITNVLVGLCGAGFKENLFLEVKIGTPIEHIILKWAKKGEFQFIKNSVLTGEVLNDLSIPIDTTFSSIIALPVKESFKFMPFVKPGFKSDSYTNTFVAKFLPFVKKETSLSLYGETRACISCSYCEDVCPVNIIPHLLYKYISKGFLNETKKFGIEKCIDCNLCTYVCPSKILISEEIKKGKEKIEEI